MSKETKKITIEHIKTIVNGLFNKNDFMQNEDLTRINVSNLFVYLLQLGYEDCSLPFGSTSGKKVLTEMKNRIYGDVEDNLLNPTFLNEIKNKEVSLAELLLKIGEYIRYYNQVMVNENKHLRKTVTPELSKEDLFYIDLSSKKARLTTTDVINSIDLLQLDVNEADVQAIVDGEYYSKRCVEDAKSFGYNFAKSLRDVIFDEPSKEAEKKKYLDELKALRHSKREIEDKTSIYFNDFAQKFLFSDLRKFGLVEDDFRKECERRFSIDEKFGEEFYQDFQNKLKSIVCVIKNFQDDICADWLSGALANGCVEMANAIITDPEIVESDKKLYKRRIIKALFDEKSIKNFDKIKLNALFDSYDIKIINRKLMQNDRCECVGFKDLDDIDNLYQYVNGFMDRYYSGDKNFLNEKNLFAILSACENFLKQNKLLHNLTEEEQTKVELIEVMAKYFYRGPAKKLTSKEGEERE